MVTECWQGKTAEHRKRKDDGRDKRWKLPNGVAVTQKPSQKQKHSETFCPVSSARGRKICLRYPCSGSLSCYSVLSQTKLSSDICQQKRAKGWADSLPWVRGCPKSELPDVSRSWSRADENLPCCSNFVNFIHFSWN